MYQRLAAYGEAGRQNYTFRNLTVDLILPLSVLPFLVLLMARAFAADVGAARHLWWLAIPVIYVLFDFAENALVLSLIAQYPTRLDVLAASLPYVTVIKRLASLLAIAIPLGVLIVRRIRPATGAVVKEVV